MKKNLVILSGAGMSAESGISTFRDAGGLWDKYPVMQVASAEGYVRDPELVINFYNERRKQLLDVEPNAGHIGLAELEKDFNVTVGSKRVMFFISSRRSRISLPLAGAQLPFSIRPTVRFCTIRAFMSWRKLYMAG